MKITFLYFSLALAIGLVNGFGSPAASEAVSSNAGSLDTRFSASMGVYPNWSNGPGGRKLLVRPDGRVFISGTFLRVQDSPRSGIARLDAHGSLDRGFAPAIQAIQDMALQSDGKLMVAGGVAMVNGNAVYPGLARLNQDGSWDASFSPSSQVDATAVAILDNGQIAAGIKTPGINSQPSLYSVALFDDLGKPVMGWYTYFESTNPIVSLVSSPDGKRLIANSNVELALDATGPNHRYLTNGFPEGFVPYCSLFQPDGKLLIGGEIYNAPNLPTTHAIQQPVLRLNQDGTLDSSFSTNLTIGMSSVEGGITYLKIFSLAVQTDGKIYIGGFFTQVSGKNRTLVARLESNGELDPAFIPDIKVNTNWDVDALETVSTMALTPEGLVIGGIFTTINGLECHSVARLHTTSENSASILAFDQPSYNVWETNGTMEVVVRRYNQINQSVSVYYDASEASGISQVPHPLRGHLIFAPDEIAKIITIPLLDNRIIENNKSFYLTLSQPDGGAVLTSNPQTQITIFDDDSMGFPGSVDLAYAPDLGLNGRVYDLKILAVEPDESLLLQVYWTANDYDYRYNLIRIDSNGHRDTNFMVTTDRSIESVIVTNGNGNILIAGNFETVNNEHTPYLARIDRHGVLDPNFKVDINGWVHQVTAPYGGTFYISGGFSRVNNVERHRLARLNMDGSVDMSFDTSKLSLETSINDMNVQPDGTILLCGSFNQGDPANRQKMERIKTDGSLDTSFTLTAFQEITYINSIHRQPHGKLLVVGWLTASNGQSGTVARINPDGSIDTDFSIFNMNDDPNAPLLILPDGKITVAGKWRLNSNGTLDRNYFAGATPNYVNSVYRLANGNLLLSGSFSTFNEFPRPNLVQLRNGDSPTPNLVEFVNSSLVVSENDGTVQLVVHCTGEAQTSASVNYTTIDLTAIAGVDYTAVAGTLTFAPGVTEQTISIPILDNNIVQNNRYFSVRLFNPTAGLFLNADYPATIDIVEDDAGVRFRHAQYWVPGNWTTANENLWLVADLERTGSASTPLTIQCRLDGGTAQAGVDYVATNLTLQFEANQTELSFYVPLLKNDSAATDRSVNLTLNNPQPSMSLADPSIASMTIIAPNHPLHLVMPQHPPTADGSLNIVCDILPGQYLKLQTSTNLVDWMDAGWVYRGYPDGPVNFEDHDAWKFPQRYYRAIQYPAD